MSMNRRDAFRGIVAAAATAGASVTAIDAVGSVKEPGDAVLGKEPFLLVLQARNPLKVEAVAHLKEQLNELIAAAGVNCKCAVLPWGIDIATIKPDGTISAATETRPSPEKAPSTFPWMGTVLYDVARGRDPIAVNFVSMSDQLGPGLRRRRLVTLTLRSSVRPLREPLFGGSGEFNLPEDVVTTHTIQVIEATHSLDEWGACEAVSEHRKAIDRFWTEYRIKKWGKA